MKDSLQNKLSKLKQQKFRHPDIESTIKFLLTKCTDIFSEDHFEESLVHGIVVTWPNKVK